MSKHLTWVLGALLLSGCAASYQQTPVNHSGQSLERGVGVLIATPENGAYNNEVYARSGEYTANALSVAFQPYASPVNIVQCASLACVQRGDSMKARYVVVPRIARWEDRATEWSGKPDQIEIEISVFDASSSEKLASTVLSGKSQWATMGGDHPQDLLKEPLESFVKTLY